LDEAVEAKVQNHTPNSEFEGFDWPVYIPTAILVNNKDSDVHGKMFDLNAQQTVMSVLWYGFELLQSSRQNFIEVF
jgi:hypothetical protein